MIQSRRITGLWCIAAAIVGVAVLQQQTGRVIAKVEKGPLQYLMVKRRL